MTVFLCFYFYGSSDPRVNLTWISFICSWSPAPSPLPLKSVQGFSNSVIVRGGEGMRNFTGGREIVLWVDENLRRSVFDYSNLFSKLKTRICKYWTLIKIKITMTCVYKKYKCKMKIVQEQWLQLKWSFFWFMTRKLLFSGRTNLWWGQQKYCGCGLLGGFFQMGGDIVRKHIVRKHTQVNITNLLNGWQATAGFIGKWFKKASLVNKTVNLL